MNINKGRLRWRKALLVLDTEQKFFYTLKLSAHATVSYEQWMYAIPT